MKPWILPCFNIREGQFFTRHQVGILRRKIQLNKRLGLTSQVQVLVQELSLHS